MKIQYKKTEGLIVPKRGTPKAAGYDVVALTDPQIVGAEFGKSKDGSLTFYTSVDYIEYKTGLFIAPQTDEYSREYHTFVMPRSSLSKYNLVLCNSIALIDNDYRGEILLRFKYIWQPEDFGVDPDTGRIVGNVNTKKIYNKGDKIGQIVSEVTNPIDWIEVLVLDQTVRGEGGFGSTDIPKEPVLIEVNESPKNIQLCQMANIIDKWRENNVLPKHEPYEQVMKEKSKVG